MRERYLYKGNGEVKDRLDYFVTDYLRKKKLYIEVTYI